MHQIENKYKTVLAKTTDVWLACCSLQDYNSLFPLDDTQPSKLMRLLSSNEDEPVALSSPGQSKNIWFQSMIRQFALPLFFVMSCMSHKLFRATFFSFP